MRPVPDYTITDLESLRSVEFDQLTNDDAVALGLIAIQVIQEWDLNLAVDIVLHGDLIFRAKLKLTDASNNQWLAGKAAVATQFGEPSLLVKMRHLQAGTPFEERVDVDHYALRAFGGSIPLRVRNSVVGTLTLSGEADVVDHQAAAEILHRYQSTLGKEI